MYYFGNVLENNMKLDSNEKGNEFLDWISLAQDKDKRRPLMSSVIYLCSPGRTSRYQIYNVKE
jgi:hypothetical protein